MKRMLRKMVLAGVLGVTGCYATVAAPPPGEVVVETAPPPPPREVIPAAPQPGYVWIEGHWQWNGVRYVWVGGYYVAPRVGFAWVPHRWWRGPRGRWHYGAGYWRRM
jgi:hypothetical protein